MQTSNESYQNSNSYTNNQNKQIILKKISKLHSKNIRTFILHSFSGFLCDRKKISFKKYFNFSDRLSLKRESNNELISKLNDEYSLLKAS